MTWTELTHPQRERIAEWLRLGDDDERADDAIVKIISASGRPICSLTAAWLKALVTVPHPTASDIAPERARGCATTVR